MRNKKVLFITQAAIIAALYFVFAWISNVAGLASNAIQCRISEAFCVFAAFTPAAIPGLTIGCFLFNLSSGCIMIDVLLGSLASLLGALGTYFLAKLVKDKNKLLEFIIPLPTVFANAVIVPMYLPLYGITTPYWLNFLTVGAGEFICCEILGMILYKVMAPKQAVIFAKNN